MKLRMKIFWVLYTLFFSFNGILMIHYLAGFRIWWFIFAFVSCFFIFVSYYIVINKVRAFLTPDFSFKDWRRFCIYAVLHYAVLGRIVYGLIREVKIYSYVPSFVILGCLWYIVLLYMTILTTKRNKNKWGRIGIMGL